MVSPLRLIIGLHLNLLIWIMLALNVFVLVCIKKGRLCSGRDNAVYLLSTFNIVCDSAQLLVHAFYIGPSILTGKWFFDGQESLGVTIVAVLFLGFWILASLIQVLFSTNRTIPDQRWFGYSILQKDNLENDSYWFGLFLDAGVTVYSGISYIALMFYVVKLGGSTSNAHKREIRCILQFFLMFVTYGVIWMTFYLYPVIGFQVPEAYVVTPMLLVFNSGVNSLIFLALNKDIIIAAHELLHGNSVSRITTSPHIMLIRSVT
ncbi:unnamed protein product [Cylicocyclus nassatus]|uniref:Uncharacterized protein n=1 Tax=Cylicocyclus nassatus TaxID=53992 RepID=A0AA36DV96_CYLNA|nr:unnamed protein product [Cylicocyclus nassatus]